MDIESRLIELANCIRESKDREAIRNVIASYGPAVDHGNSSAAANLWSPDGTYDVEGYGINEGRAAIEKLLGGPDHMQLIAGGAAHFLSPVKLEISGDSAIAVGYSCLFKWNGENFSAFRVSANRWTLKRTDGIWHVSNRINRLLNGSPAARAALQIQDSDQNQLIGKQ